MFGARCVTSADGASLGEDRLHISDVRWLRDFDALEYDDDVRELYTDRELPMSLS